MTLRLVKPDEPKPPRRRRGRGHSYEEDLLTPDEHKRAMQGFRNLRDAFGTWSCLADAMRVPKNALAIMMRRGTASVAMLYAASKASGLAIEELLGAPVPTDRCRACGQVKRYARAS